MKISIGDIGMFLIFLGISLYSIKQYFKTKQKNI